MCYNGPEHSRFIDSKLAYEFIQQNLPVILTKLPIGREIAGGLCKFSPIASKFVKMLYVSDSNPNLYDVWNTKMRWSLPKNIQYVNEAEVLPNLLRLDKKPTIIFGNWCLSYFNNIIEVLDTRGYLWIKEPISLNQRTTILQTQMISRPEEFYDDLFADYAFFEVISSSLLEVPEFTMQKQWIIQSKVRSTPDLIGEWDAKYNQKLWTPVKTDQSNEKLRKNLFKLRHDFTIEMTSHIV